MSRTIKQFRPAPRGFTLIELIIAMAMVAVVAVVLADSLRLAFNATDSANAVVEPASAADITMQFMCDDLQNALQPGTDLGQNFVGTQGQDARGHEADDLVFYSTADSPQHANANGEIKQIEFKVVQSPDGDYYLVRRVIRNLLAQTLPGPDEEIICRGVWSFSLQYFNGSTWSATWDSTQEDNTIPAAVQVTLELQRPGTNGVMHTAQFSRAFLLPCSTAAQDPAVNLEQSF